MIQLYCLSRKKWKKRDVDYDDKYVQWRVTTTEQGEMRRVKERNIKNKKY